MSLTFDGPTAAASGPGARTGETWRKQRPKRLNSLPMLSIQEAAHQIGTTVRALRYYEAIGLLQPTRSDCNSRLYSSKTLAQARRIVALRFVGMTPAEIAAILGESLIPDAKMVERLTVMLAQADARLFELRALLNIYKS